MIISGVIICNMKSGPLGNFSLKRLSTDWRYFFFLSLGGRGGGSKQLFRSPLSAEFGSGLRCAGGKERSHRLWNSVRVESGGQ